MHGRHFQRMKHPDSNVELDHRSNFSKYDITVTFITVEEIFGCIHYIVVKPTQCLTQLSTLTKEHLHSLQVEQMILLDMAIYFQ